MGSLVLEGLGFVASCTSPSQEPTLSTAHPLPHFGFCVSFVHGQGSAGKLCAEDQGRFAAP